MDRQEARRQARPRESRGRATLDWLIFALLGSAPLFCLVPPELVRQRYRQKFAFDDIDRAAFMLDGAAGNDYPDVQLSKAEVQAWQALSRQLR
jgi:hypothetical protein